MITAKCEGCQNDKRLTEHHLKPQASYDRKAKGYTVQLCHECHELIHSLYTNDELREMTKGQQISAIIKANKKKA